MRRLADGTLVFMARGHLSDETYERDAGAPGRVNYLYRSADGGRTWQPPSPIRRGWSETGFLPLDGEHWVAYVRHNEQPNQIAHSYDGGESFETDHEYVLSDLAFSWDCGYPSMVCYDDGLVVTTAYSLMDLNHEEWGDLLPGLPLLPGPARRLTVSSERGATRS